MPVSKSNAIMCADKAFISKKDRPRSHNRDKKVSEITVRELIRLFEDLRVEIKDLKVAKTAGTFAIKIKSRTRLPAGKLSDLTVQDLLDSLGNLELSISNGGLTTVAAMSHGVKPGS
jgi:hypothetical protein